MQLRLKNVQSHVDTVLDITGNFVAITGPNNVGKSAIIRAVRWVLYDALRGSRFITKGQAQASVEMRLDDHIVTRIKGDGKNAYVCDDTTLEAINKGVPIEVSTLLNVRPILVDKDLELELNVSRQSEHPFLMGVTGSVRSKVLNTITGSHILDAAARETTTVLKRLHTSHAESAERISALDTELKKYEGLETKRQVISEAKVLQAKIKELDQKKGRLVEMQLRYHNLVSDLAILKAKPTVDLSQVDGAVSRIESLLAYKKILSDAVGLSAVLLAEKNSLTQLESWCNKEISEYKALAGSECPNCGQTLTEKCLEEAL